MRDLEATFEEAKLVLVPPDTADEGSAIVEIRAGAYCHVSLSHGKTESQSLLRIRHGRAGGGVVCARSVQDVPEACHHT